MDPFLLERKDIYFDNLLLFVEIIPPPPAVTSLLPLKE